jgi:hypothetical protein
MGRKASWDLYRRKSPDGTPYGSWRYWSSKSHSVVDTQTEDEATAQAAMAVEMETDVIPDIPEIDNPVPISAPSQSSPMSSINAWLGDRPPIDSGNGAPEVVHAEPISQSNPPSVSNGKTPLRALIPPKKKGLSPEQAERLGKALTSIVTKVNLMGLETVTKLCGRDPLGVDEEDIDLLRLGWEMYLEEYFVKHTPKPWMLIAAGNVFLLTAMLINSEKIEGKEKPKELDAPSSAS